MARCGGETCCGGETLILMRTLRVQKLWWGEFGGEPKGSKRADGRGCGGETLVGTLRVQKGRWARNGSFPFKNDFSLVYSTIAEIRDKFDHFVPLWWGDPAVVRRPRCGGETPLWWGDPAVVRPQVLNLRSRSLILGFRNLIVG